MAISSIRQARLSGLRSLWRSATRAQLENLESRLLLSTTVSVGDGTLLVNATAIRFAVTLSEASDSDIHLNWQTSDNGSAAQNRGYYYERAPGETIIPAGSTSGYIDVPTNLRWIYASQVGFDLAVTSVDAAIAPATIHSAPLSSTLYSPHVVDEGDVQGMIKDKPSGGTLLHGSSVIHLQNLPTAYSDVDADQDDDYIVYTAPGGFWMIYQRDLTPDAPDLVDSSDTGDSSTDNITSLDNSSPDKRLTFHFTGQAPTTSSGGYKLYMDGQEIGSGTGIGDITTNGTTPISAGEHQFTVVFNSYNGVPNPSQSLTVTIDPPLTYSIGSVTEVDNDGFLSFPVTLSKPSAVDVTISWHVTNPHNYSPYYTTLEPSTLVIPAGETTGTIEVPMSNSTTWHPDQQYTLVTSSGNAEFSGPAAVGTVQSDALGQFDFSSSFTITEGTSFSVIKFRIKSGPPDVTISLRKISGADSVHLGSDNFDSPMPGFGMGAYMVIPPHSDFDADDVDDVAVFEFSAPGYETLTVTVTQNDVTTEVPPPAEETPPVTVDAPLGVVATDDLTTKVTVSWNAASGAESYNVFRSLTDDFANAVQINLNPITSTSYDDATAVADTVYYYFVQAVNGEVFSDGSASDSGHVVADPNDAAAATTVTTPRAAPAYAFGRNITLISTLKSTPASGNVFDGVITIVDQATSNVLGTGVIRGRTATFVLSNLPPGNYSAIVRYAGDDNHAAVDSVAFAINVNAGVTITQLKTAMPGAVFGQSVTLTALVKSGINTARTGTVTFYDGNVQIGSPVTVDGNSASITFTPASAGGHKYRAVYSGDSNFAASNAAPIMRLVLKARTAAVFEPSLIPATSSDVFDLAVKISILGAGAGTPGGTVTIRDNGHVLAVIAVDAQGIATLPAITLSQGQHRLMAFYTGDGNFAVAVAAIQLTIV